MAHRHHVISVALLHGYNAFLPIIDQGIDFILHRASDDRSIKVQLKSRSTIDRKYEKYQDLWVAFPAQKEWYLMPHSEMIAAVESSAFTSTPQAG
jgi:hypothetical protein